MSKRFATRILVAVLAGVLAPSLCEAAGCAFYTSSGSAMSTGSQLRLRFHAQTFSQNGMPGQDEDVQIVNLTPTAQYEYYGTYYYSYSWNTTLVTDGQSYAYSTGVAVECFMNSEWVPYSTQTSTMTSVP